MVCGCRRRCSANPSKFNLDVVHGYLVFFASEIEKRVLLHAVFFWFFLLKVQILSMNFISLNGRLELVGKIQKHTVTNTKGDSTSLFLGQMSSSHLFGGIRKGSSRYRTTREIIQVLSFLKVGGDSYDEVVVPKLAMYELLKKGDDVGVVLSANGRELLAVNNHTLDTKFKATYSAKWSNISFILGIVLMIWGVDQPQNELLLTPLGLFVLIMACVFKLISRSNWHAALSNIGWK